MGHTPACQAYNADLSHIVHIVMDQRGRPGNAGFRFAIEAPDRTTSDADVSVPVAKTRPGRRDSGTRLRKRVAKTAVVVHWLMRFRSRQTGGRHEFSAGKR